MIVEGRTWCFGDQINTDLMYPNTAFRATEADRRWLVFEANRPGWSRQVQAGDIIVAGHNFGTGSGRPASKVLLDLGIVCVVAETVNGLFLRNSVNYGLPIMECAGVTELVEEGQHLRVDVATGEVENMRTGQRAVGEPLPSLLLDILREGGLLPSLEKEGYIAPG